MSLRQLGQRLSITLQSVKEIEKREKSGTVSLKVLRQVARALNMKFFYGFVPADITLEGMIEKRAAELAEEIAVRYKHSIVSIHPFPNGNGRHSRICSDILVSRVFKRPVFPWGGSRLDEEGKTRNRYMMALYAADQGDIKSLLVFARSGSST
jgi:transcriptional regulator with XRE-family HTH domain